VLTCIASVQDSTAYGHDMQSAERARRNVLAVGTHSQGKCVNKPKEKSADEA